MALIAIVYLLAAVAFVGVFALLRSRDLLFRGLAADVVSTVVVFIASVLLDNSSIYDPYWSVFPPILYVAWAVAGASLSARGALIIILTIIWAFRLTRNWAVRWNGLDHEDWRYRDFRSKAGRAYWPISFLGIHLFPTLTVFAASLPVYFAVTRPRAAFGWLDLVATAVVGAAILLEAVADAQMNAFRARAGGGVVREGVWRYSRHPNYLGELSFWLGMLLYGAAAGAPVWTAAGMVCVMGVFFGYSIPMMERRLLASRPEYDDIRNQVSMLIPLPPRSRRL